MMTVVWRHDGDYNDDKKMMIIQNYDDEENYGDANDGGKCEEHDWW